MKDLVKVLATRPAISFAILMIGLAMLLNPSTTLANDVEKELVLESWMTAPFDNELQESEMSLESWMAVPFDNETQESELKLESWMALPPGIENVVEEVSTEVWMSTAWV